MEIRLYKNLNFDMGTLKLSTDIFEVPFINGEG